MRILQISFTLLNGGKENMLIDIANEQHKQGHSIAIIVLNNRVDVDVANRLNHGIKLYQLNRKGGSKNPLPILKLFFLIHFIFRPDTVHSHDVHLGKILKKLWVKHSILTIHDNGIETEPMKHFNRLVSISDSVKKDVESRSNLKCTTVYNGVVFNQIVKKTKAPSGDQSKINLIQVSRLQHQKKGQDILLKALHHIVYIENRKEFELTFIGDGESKEFLQSQVRKLELEDAVKFSGNKNREWIYSKLHCFDVFIQPSRFEGFGLTVVEAVAAGLPVIASSGTGSAEVLGNGAYGFIFKNGDHLDLSKVILHVSESLKNDDLKSFIEVSHKHCISLFNMKKTAREYIDVYSNI